MRHRRAFTEEWQIIAVGAAFVLAGVAYVVLAVTW